MRLLLSKNELFAITGGAISWGIVGIIVTAVSFLVGVFDGIARPFKCR